jgi:predicted DNA-binding protein YlxM (UPF0122 family)
MDNIEKNTQWLSEYQDDLIKIVSKYRRPQHVQSVEEIISDINNHMLSKLIDMQFDNQVEFKKFTYRTAINFVKWNAKGSTNKDKKYYQHRVDVLVKSEDPDIETAFDLAVITLGQDDPEFEAMNKSTKFENIKKWIFEYSNFLSSNQKTILPYVLKGRKLSDIADAIGVTHQAVSFMVIEIFERIKSNIKIKYTDEDEILSIGNRSVKFLFGKKRLESRRKNHYKKRKESYGY